MHRLRLVLGLSAALGLSAVTAGDSLSTKAHNQVTLHYLPPFGICHDITTNDATSSICPVYGDPNTNQSDNEPKIQVEQQPPPPYKTTCQTGVPQPEPSAHTTAIPKSGQQQDQPKPGKEKDNSKEEKKASSPWSRGAICRRVGKDDFCAFTHSSFNNGEGISIITTPLVFVGLSSQPPLSSKLNTPTSPPPKDSTSTQGQQDIQDQTPYKDVSIPGKGIGLVATSPIRSGKRIMSRTPAVMVDDRAFRGLRRDDLAILLAQAILGLPDIHRDRFLNLSSSHDSASSSPPTDSPVSAKEKAQKQVDLIYQIFSTNAFKTTVKVVLPDTDSESSSSSTTEQPVPENKIKEISFHSTFTQVSRLNHDCSPNLGYYFDTTTLSHKVYAVKDIYPGEELTVSYVNVLHPRETRRKLLKSTWGFDCSCERCGGAAHSHNHNNDDEHLLLESDSRVEQINALRRELDNYSSPPPNTNTNTKDTSSKSVKHEHIIGTGTPTKAQLLITLYNLEGAQVRIYEAYYRAALEYNGIGDSTNAMIYARLCLAKGLIARGPDRPFIAGMQELIRDPSKHWSWRFRLGGGDGSDSGAGSGAGTTSETGQPETGEGKGDNRNENGSG